MFEQRIKYFFKVIYSIANTYETCFAHHLGTWGYQNIQVWFTYAHQDRNLIDQKNWENLNVWLCRGALDMALKKVYYTFASEIFYIATPQEKEADKEISSRLERVEALLADLFPLIQIYLIPLV